MTRDVVLVSILAGAEVASLRKRFPNAGAIVRAMPNLPVEIRRGVVALYSEDADDALKQQLGDLFVALGWAMWTFDEAKLGGDRIGCRRRPRLCRQVRARACQGRRGARPLHRDRLDHRARDRARHVVDGRDER